MSLGKFIYINFPNLTKLSLIFVRMERKAERFLFTEMSYCPDAIVQCHSVSSYFSIEQDKFLCNLWVTRVFN